LIYPARIVKYYPENQTADIQVCAEKVFNNYDELLQVISRQVLKMVPVHTASGGGWSITMPIAVGDTCLVVFSAIGYDHWLFNDHDKGGLVAGQPAPHLLREFDENDGFCIVGFNTLPRAIASYNTTDSEWRNTDRSQVIALKADGSIMINSEVTVDITAPEVTITGNLTVTGKTTSGTSETLGLSTASGDLAVAGTTTSGGINLNTHIHTGDSGGTTSPPL